MSEYKKIKDIVIGKLVDKTMDKDYEDLSEDLFGEGNCYNSSEVRKRMYGMKRLLEVLENEQINSSDNEIIKEIEDKKRELAKERRKLQIASTEYRNTVINKDAKLEMFYETLQDTIDRLPIPKLERMIPVHGNVEEVLAFADIHYGANFKSVNNTYSIKECERRFEVMLNETIEYVIDNNVGKLKVLGLGDDIQGMLRISDIKMNETTVVESVVGVSRLIATFLNELSAYCEVEYLHSPTANHTQIRPLGTKASELASEDMEKLIINYISDLLGNNDRVIVHNFTNTDRLMFKILDFECLMMHGHQIKNVKNAIKDLSMLHRRFFDYVFLGHYHGSQTISSGESDVQSEVIVVPSMVGSCPYADSLMVGSKAMAQIYRFKEGKGHVCTTNILLN